MYVGGWVGDLLGSSITVFFSCWKTNSSNDIVRVEVDAAQGIAAMVQLGCLHCESRQALLSFSIEKPDRRARVRLSMECAGSASLEFDTQFVFQKSVSDLEKRGLSGGVFNNFPKVVLAVCVRCFC